VALEPAKILPRRLGRYQLFAHIGRGGMADIYLARADTSLGDATRLVVIKEVLPRLVHGPGFAEMLVSEAKLAAKLSHANVVAVEDLGRAGGSLFIAMEYVEGLDLRELLRRCARGRIALPVELSLRIVVEALRGLSFAHRARDEEGLHLGIVHRDVSPSNVLLSFEGEVKLCDFGIARANALADELPEEAVVGKAGYMSPEQARGEALDPRSDVFAAGIVLWELLAGRRLYKAGAGERLIDLARAAAVPALPARDLPKERALYAIVARALRKGRDERYPTAAALLDDLEEYVASARMEASQIRFGEWLTERFAYEIVRDRRARELAMRAIAQGPVAVILPLPAAIDDTARPAWLPPAPTSLLADQDVTPSAFPVVRSAPSAPKPSPSKLAPVDPRDETPISGVAIEPAKRTASGVDPRLFAYALLLVGVAYVALLLLVR
jgi:serine/threonine-protein kinase